ncbi:MAG: TRAP transporter TatT component family protein [bacterium]
MNLMSACFITISHKIYWIVGVIFRTDRFRTEGYRFSRMSSASCVNLKFFDILICIVTLIFFFNGCSLKRLAVNSLADALISESSSVYATDDDPELVGEALPFALKTTESLLQITPKHKGLLITAASGFVQYAHAYVLWPANSLESHDLAVARKGRARAKRLFLRAREYGLRALELSSPGITQALINDPLAAVAKLDRADVPALYWTGAAWGSAISVAKDDMALVGDVPIVRSLLQRALELNESWGDGAIHEFFLVFEAGRSEADGGGIEPAETHVARAMELNGGRSITPLVSLAETVCVRQQNRNRFKSLLLKALAFDVNLYPEKRLSNILAQRRAEELLDNIDELFFVDDEIKEKKEPHTN